MFMSTSASSSSSMPTAAIATVAVATAAVVANAVAVSILYNKMDKLESDANSNKKNKSKKMTQKTAPLCNHCNGHNHDDQHSCDDHDHNQSIVITLPKWTEEFVNEQKGKLYKTDEEMMQVAMDLADRNITEGTGGPFGTAIFEHDVITGDTTLFSIGINQVVSLGNSTLHGEMTAIQFGEKKLGTFAFPRAKNSNTRDLLGSTKEYHLYTSCAPCAQCLGGTLWSGVSKLVCGAGKEDAEAIGFDEGPVYAQSYDALEASGCTVKHGVLREQGAAILRKYAETGVIYNADSS
mmetsp:Transcript_53959/g.131028  ORF Transcript_53959/g.131028 Transcript_53959/m.131028 type:complete len:293 (+) Transcript_53959:125-1003(+)